MSRRHGRAGTLAAAVLACLVLVQGQAVGRAQERTQAVPSAEDAIVEPVGAPVVVDGYTLFHVAGLTSYPAETRARIIAGRIEVLAADPAFDPASLRVQESEQVVEVLAGTRLVLAIVDADARVEGVEAVALARYATERIQAAIVRHRYDRRTDVLGRHAMEAVAWTLVVGLVLWVTLRLLRWGRVRLERRYASRVRGLEVQSFTLVSVEQVWRLVAAFTRAAWVVGAAIALFVLLESTLTRFPWTRRLGRELAAITIRPLQTMGTAILESIPDLVFLAVLVLVTRYLLRLLRLFFDGIAEGRLVFRSFDADWGRPTYRLVRLVVVAFAVVVAYPYIPGSQTDAFKGVSLFLGVMFSLGSSSMIGNMIASYSMTYRRAFRVGDRVKIGQHVGDIEQVRMMVTHLRTLKNEEVVVPNSLILGTEVVNYSSKARSEGLILHTTVGIGYETPWRQVEAMLIEAASRVPGLLKVPPPFILQTALGDFCVTYELNVYCADPQTMLARYSDLHRNILDVFNEYGVQIMTPAYMADPPQRKVVPRSDWYTAPAKAPDGASHS